MNNEQEIINNYLKNNPLKAKQRKQDRYHCRPCSAGCGNRVTAKFKRPVSTHNGEMNSLCGRDYIKDFPKHEEEDLCVSCKTSIRFYNREGSDNYTGEMIEDYNSYGQEDEQIEIHTNMYSENLDQQHLTSEMSYQGYGSIDGMEGTYFDGENTGFGKMKDYWK